MTTSHKVDCAILGVSGLIIALCAALLSSEPRPANPPASLADDAPEKTGPLPHFGTQPPQKTFQDDFNHVPRVRCCLCGAVSLAETDENPATLGGIVPATLESEAKK